MMPPPEGPLARLFTSAYVGSEQCFLPHAEEYFRVHRCQTLVAPFSGSGIAGLSLLDGGVVERLVLVEQDPRIARVLKRLATDPALAGRVTVVKGNALEVMGNYAGDRNVGCFADPPRRHEPNHRKLFSVLAGWRGPWLLTQDDSPLARRLALCYRFASREVLVTMAGKKKNELLLWRERRFL
jgi:hypothetical protein